MLSWHKYLSLCCILVSSKPLEGTDTEYEVLRMDENCQPGGEKTIVKTHMSYYIDLFNQTHDMDCNFTVKMPRHWLKRNTWISCLPGKY